MYDRPLGVLIVDQILTEANYANFSEWVRIKCDSTEEADDILKNVRIEANIKSLIKKTLIT